MKLFCIEQIEVYQEWDYYESAVVIAKDEEAARHVHPAGYPNKDNNKWWIEGSYNCFGSWCTPDNVVAQEIGIPNQEIIEHTPDLVVMSSFVRG